MAGLIDNTMAGLVRTVTSEKGVDAAAIREITDRADLGCGNFYNHFDSKDDLAGGARLTAIRLDCCEVEPNGRPRSRYWLAGAGRTSAGPRPRKRV